MPAKGRLRDPSFHLLEDAGLGPEQPGDRALAFPCRNAPVEVLLVRAADVPEYVQDGVVDCGITGIDLVRERGAEVRELLSLGFGSCRLEAAVPEESQAQSLAELAGLSVATVYPHLTQELLPVDVTLVDVTGSVEIAPRLGLPTRSSTWSHPATRSARTDCVRSACCSSRKPCLSRATRRWLRPSPRCCALSSRRVATAT